MRRREFVLSGLLQASVAFVHARHPSIENRPLEIAEFEEDVTPPLGCPLLHGWGTPAKKVLDPLKARGIVLFTAQGPLVLCSMDWIGISNASHDAFRKALADAVGTTPDRVAVHCIHQHNAPGVDASAEKILVAHGLGNALCDAAFVEDATARVARAARRSMGKRRPVTHVGCGMGKVEGVASTRRVLTPDGELRFWRSSAGGNKQMKNAPDGLIDPNVRLLAFWNGDTPVASVTYYACHSCAFYGKGGVSSEIMGLARTARDVALPGVAHIHFNGAGGDLAVGKYNDNTPATRPRLAKRLAEGMKAAWQSQKRTPVTASDVQWRVRSVALPVKKSLREDKLLQAIGDGGRPTIDRVRDARKLAWLRLVEAGRKIDLSCLQIGPARVLHMPGELFLEYQLAAQRMRPDAFVCMAAYGDLGTSYICTREAYRQGGYEPGPSRVSPEAEDVLMSAIAELLKDEP